MIHAYRYFPLFSLAAAFLLIVVLRSVLHWLRYGCSGLSYSWTERQLIGWIVGAMAWQAAEFIGWKDYEHSIPLFILGAVLFALSIVGTWVCQGMLGISWRASIDENAMPGLKTCGVYAYCRNPIVICLGAAMTGYVLMIPTLLSLGLWLIVMLVLRWQVRREEAWLLLAYGRDYERYAKRTGRFLPRLNVRQMVFGVHHD